MKPLLKMTAVAVLALTCSQTMAATDNLDIKVTGEIIPPACVPTIAGGATFDFGTMPAARVAMNDFTLLSEKTLAFSVVCSSPTKVAFQTIDARAGSAIVPTGKTLGRVAAENLNLLGLGLDGSTGIGAYEMNVTNQGLTVDGATGYVGIRSADSGSSWEIGPINCLWFDPVYTTAVARSGTTTPVAFTTLSGNLNMGAALNKGSALDLTSEIDLDGLATIQLVYL